MYESLAEHRAVPTKLCATFLDVSQCMPNSIDEKWEFLVVQEKNRKRVDRDGSVQIEMAVLVDGFIVLNESKLTIF